MLFTQGIVKSWLRHIQVVTVKATYKGKLSAAWFLKPKTGPEQEPWSSGYIMKSSRWFEIDFITEDTIKSDYIPTGDSLITR